MSDDQNVPLDFDTGTLDDIEDLPGFAVFLSGAYRIELPNGMVRKEVNGKQAVAADMKLLEIMELSEAPVEGETPPKIGDINNILFMTNNKTGAGFYKQFATPISEKLGTRNLNQINEGSRGMQLLVVLKRTYSKEKGKHYSQVVRVAVL